MHIFILSILFSKYLELCYKVYFTFIEVGETCIRYEINQQENTVEINSVARTTKVGKLVKKLYNYGYCLIDGNTLSPKIFRYFQQEFGFFRFQEYIFGEDNKISVKIIRYDDQKMKSIKEKDEFVYVRSDELDPYSAALFISKNSNSSGTVKVFYEKKSHNIHYSFRATEILGTDIGNFESHVVEIKPEVETSGVLKPKGNWIAWFSSKKHILLKMKIDFTIGNIVMEVKKLKGYEDLLTEIGF